MFVTYLRRELRRRARQAVLVCLGLALGIGLVITVTAASAGVRDAQAQVLHSLYGVGTDITVTQAPAAGAGGFGGFGFGFDRGSRTRPAPGTKVTTNRVAPGRLAPIGVTSVTSIAGLRGVAGASGALVLNDIKLSLTIPSFSPGSGQGRGTFKPPATFTVTGVDLARGALGPLASGTIVSGRTLAPSGQGPNVAVVDSGYAAQNKLAVGGTVAIGDTAGKGTDFTIVGIVRTPSGSSDVYIPLARAQALAGLAGKVNTVYVAATSATQITAVSREISALLPKATVTTASSLAGEVTGSLANAASLASSLGRWLAIVVLAAAFALACLLTLGAVSRRVREFGTLKALGWRSRRIVGQVMGEALAVGLIGGAAGIALGYAGSALVGALTPALTAVVSPATGSAAPGGNGQFRGSGGVGSNGGFGPGGGAPGGALRRLAAEPSVTVHLSAPVTIGVIGIAVLLAIAGGLLAGGFGSWRAARLRPAAALARVA